MNSDLAKLSLKELWVLFPIIIKKHNPKYKKWCIDEYNKLTKSCFSSEIVRINHIGSTYIADLAAKPIIDILLEVSDNCNAKNLIKELETNGWLVMSKEYKPELKIVLNKGYTPKGFAEKVYHLHIRHFNDWDELYFRDYLVNNKEIRNEYEALKYSLLDKYKNNRDGYTKAKGEFIKKITILAKEKYKDRYK